MEVEEAIKQRKSVRKFLDRRPDWRKIILAIDAARYAPMAGNLFSLKFILVSDKARIDKISAACQQDFVGKVNYIVVVVSDDTKVKQSYDVFGEKYAREQAGAAIENFLIELTAQGLATCWVGSFEDSQVKTALKIPESFIIDGIFPIGIESNLSRAEKRVKKPELENIMYFEEHGQDYEKSTKVQIINR